MYHVFPRGPQTTNDHKSVSSDSWDETQTAVLQELSSQLGQLSLNMKDMQDDLKTVWSELRSVCADLPASSWTPHSWTNASDYLSAGGSSAPTTEAHLCLPSGAKVSPKTLAMAKTCEFINLADFEPCLELLLMMETSLVDSKLVFRPKRNIKSIDSFLLWSMA